MLNRERRYIGLRNDALTDLGAIQAQQLADALAAFPISAIYSSPLQRAYHTALPIAVRHGLDVQLLDALCEGDFGLWEGLTSEEVKVRSQHDAELQRAWVYDPTLAPPEGESLDTMQKRVVAAVTALIQVHPNQAILLVTHTGPTKALLCTALGAPITSFTHIFLDPATVSVVDWQEAFPIVRLVNSHAHLDWEQPRWMR
jgi:broad specificity phosphatase PhoE